MDTNNKIFIAVAWPYVNGEIHIGHLAGYLIPCDIFARYCRLKGDNTLMVSGSDCHGTPITVAADKKGVPPQEIIDEYDPKLRELISAYGISYDLFTTTMTQNHENVTKEIFLNLLRNGYIIKKRTNQYYSEKDKKFLPDRYVEGECPYCHSKEQRADQCENCTRVLDMGELIDPVSKLTKSKVTLKETEHYFIDFSKLQNDIEKYVKTHENTWRTWVWKETCGWLNEGLKPRAITRDIDWGFEIPVDEVSKINPDLSIENAESKRFYVWFDAVIGYLSAAIEWSEKTGDSWKDFWLNPECKHYYFMGKDNLAFHTIFWPGQLIGQHMEYNLPYFPSVNQFLNLDDKKFSKSRGVHIDSMKVGEYFGVEPVRFYISSILPETKDANWRWEDFRDTVNSELVGNFGNFVHRTLTFYKNKLGGTLEARNCRLEDVVETECKATFEEADSCLQRCSMVAALNRILKLSKFGNQYFDQQKPWVSLKDDRDACEESIYNCLQLVYSLQVLLIPFIPQAAGRLSQLLGLPEINSSKNILENKYIFTQLNMDLISIADELHPLFKRIEEEDIEEFINK